MAVTVQFITLVVRIDRINAHYPGGFSAYLEQQEKPVEHDDHLLRQGAMSPMDIESAVNEWKEIGLQPTEKIRGVLHWKDCCVIDYFGGPTLPCDWIELSPDHEQAFIREKHQQ